MARKPRPPPPAKAAAPPLQTVHTYPTKNANISLHVYSYPQRVPTFVGGSAARGWGALAGSVDVDVSDPSGDRISAIKLVLTAIQTTTVPKLASADAPSALDRIALDPQDAKTKQVTLLHLEKLLLEPPRNDSERDSDLLPPGRHVYPFTIDLPLVANKHGKNPPLLPPSCVIEPLLIAPNDSKSQHNTSSLFGKAKADGKTQAPPAWATVRYQLKLSVQRPGLLKRNLRSYAPFVYLPPPAPAATALLLRRRLLGAQMAAIILQRQGDGCQPIETSADWLSRPLPFLTSPNGPQKLEPDRKAGFLASLFGGAKKNSIVHWHEAWTLSMPMAPHASFPLRSAIPFVVRCATNKPIDLTLGSPLALKLYRRLRLLAGKKQKPIAVQQEAVADAALRCSVESRGLFRLNGLISLPPNCVPSFDLPGLSLDYYLAVVRVLDGSVVHKESIVLACPPPVEPKTAYGPHPSGLAWRSVQQASIQPLRASPAPDDSLLGAPQSVGTPGRPSPPLPGRQRPSVTSLASSSSSSVQARPQTRRPSEAPSLTSFRSASTDSAQFATAPSSLSHATAGVANPGSSTGLAAMANPPRASSAGASGFLHSQSSGNLNVVREQTSSPALAQAPVKVPSSREQRATRDSRQDNHLRASEVADTASVASSRTRSKYSSKGAAPGSALDLARPSSELNRSGEGSSHMHLHDKDSRLAQVSQGGVPSARAGASADNTSSRRALLAADAKNLPGIPAEAATATRQHADALVGGGGRAKPPRGKRTKETSAGRSRGASSAASERSRNVPAASSDGMQRRPERPMSLPATRTEPPPVQQPLTTPVIAPLQQHPQSAPLDPSFLLTNDDLMYGEDMELDLPPSYFEAVYGAGDDDDDD